MRSLKLIVLLLLLSLAAVAQGRDYTRWVNPFIGTGGHGHTFPGATVPFGMVQLSPDTRIDNWDGSSGYHYSDNIIYGFSHTHLSGTGIPDGCDILFMPTMSGSSFSAGSGDRTANGYVSRFSHENEKAEPGYYSVILDDDKILAEMTATKRVGFHRYTFPQPGNSTIVLDLKWRDKTISSGITLIGKDRIEGFRESSSWAKKQKVFFVARFSKPFREAQWPGGSRRNKNDENKVTSVDLATNQAAFVFDTTDMQPVLLKVAISYVSIEGARKNLEAELPGWDFDKVRREAKAAWNKELSKIEVTGGTPEQTTNFYTALYHTMIQPNVFNDVDGQYRGHDRKVHSLGQAEGSKLKADSRNSNKNSSRQPPAFSSQQYTVFSLWDTFRAAHPLYTIIDQKRTADFINTFIRQYEQGGRLPVWELWGEETDTMIGYHAVSVIADAMAKGIKGFDYEKAYRAAKHSAELNHFGLAGYKKRGYISMEDENESVSRTLEYAYDDWCIAQIQKVLDSQGNLEDVPRTFAEPQFMHRARSFENLFDPKTHFFRPKKNGGFVEPFEPNAVTFGFTEGNSWQYSFFVPQDVTRLMELMGGREKFVAKLDELLTTDQKLSGREQADLTGLIGQYAHGNEPSHHITYLYNYAGEPWKTQKYVRFIMDNFYKNAPDGLIGNEDCGQMSAWYILSAGGFYPVSPGSPVYAFGTPLFPEMTYHLENGKTFTIRAKNLAPENFYIAEAKLNGSSYKNAFITHDDIMRGGVLEFTMTGKPATAAFSEFPVSSLAVDTVAVPVINGERTFAESTMATLSTLTPNAKIHYTIDGTAPTADSRVYTAPFTIDRSTTVKAVAISAKGTASFPVESVLTRRPHDWTVKVTSGYSPQYTGGGDNAIVDGIRGTVNFASGEWQGVQGKPYEAVIDLQRPTDITELGGSFLQAAGPWIWMPDRVEFETSDDGVNFDRAAEIRPGFPQREMTPAVKEFTQKISPARARYVRVRAFNFGKIPSWHAGAGGDPWIFVDEIIIRCTPVRRGCEIKRTIRVSTASKIKTDEPTKAVPVLLFVKEVMVRMDRRYFLKSSGIGLASFGFMAAAPDFLHQFARGAEAAKGYGRKKVLVTVFQRGAVDGLNVVVPYGDSEYYDMRPTIGVPPPGKTDGAIDLDGHFGLHPSMKPLEVLWRSKQLAVIQSVGSPDSTRSHFDAQDYMESGTPGYKGTRDGWLNRALQATSRRDESPFRAVSLTSQLPRALYGKAPSVAMTNLADFSIKAGIYTQDLKGGFEGIYQQNAKDSLGEIGKETFEAVNFLKSANPAQYKPENGAAYPNNEFGRSMRQIAQLIKAGVGLEVAFTDTGNDLRWDTHSNEGGAKGQLANYLRTYSQALAAFVIDLGKRMDDVIVLTMSEFGRTARENGSRGTDHGHGNQMLVLGNSVKGGTVYADWKGLKNDQLNEGRDLAVTTDFRDVFAEAATKHLGVRDANALFPKYQTSSTKFRGFLS